METRYLDVEHGRLAYDVAGEGPLVICVPGMGELRTSYRFLAPRLVAASYRVATMDVRGHGETSVRWPDYSVAGIGADALALARALGGPTVLVGNSMASGAAVWAAAEAPDLVAGMALLAPAVRDAQSPLTARVMGAVYSALFADPWGVAVWKWYYSKLYPTTKPADFDTHLTRLVASLREPGRLAALRRMIVAPKAESEARLGRVRAPALVIMGTKDPDFKDPAGEARLVAARLTSAASVEVRIIDGAGHYPQTEMPDETAPELLSFLNHVSVRA